MKLRTITQRELRDDSGAVLRDVEGGRKIIVSRNGTPVGELRPIRRRRFVPRATIARQGTRLGSMPGSSVRISIEWWTPTPMTEPSRGANGLPLYTRNPTDFAALKRIVKIVKA